MTILVVDDDQLVALALSIRLESMGYGVIVAHSCAEGAAMVDSHRPQLVLTDITMPGGDGFALAERLRATEYGAMLPIVFVTASMDPAIRARVRATGTSGFLGKPFTAQQLKAVLTAALPAH